MIQNYSLIRCEKNDKHPSSFEVGVVNYSKWENGWGGARAVLICLVEAES